MTTVRLFTSSYAPCMVQARIEDPELLARVLGAVKANGGPDEETAVLSWEDVKCPIGGDLLLPGLTPELYHDLDRGWGVDLEMDAWDAAALYGWNAADDLMEEIA